MTISNEDILKWIEQNKDSLVVHIDSLNYQDLKSMHIACEEHQRFLTNENPSPTLFYKEKENDKFLKDASCELKYLTSSLDFCKQNISNEQYNLLNDFANIQYFYKHRNTNPNERMDSAYWAELLDKNNISWNLQNLISDIADNYENKGKYLSTHLKNNDINVGTLDNRADFIKEFYLKEAQIDSLKILVDSFDNMEANEEEHSENKTARKNKLNKNR